MTKEILDTTKNNMNKSIEALKHDLQKIRTGRTNVSMLDGIMVNYYGQSTALSQVATLACPDAKSFTITPWETTVLKDIEAAILNSSIGMAPLNDGKMIRIKVPELTEERRKDLVKQMKNTLEQVKVSVRNTRRDANEQFKKLQTSKIITEDERKQSEEEVQKFTNDYIDQISQLGEAKTKELMTV